MAKEFSFSKFKDKVDLINSEIIRVVSGDPKKLYAASNHLFKEDAGGKRIRPILCLLSCEAVGGRVSDALSTAVATELVHTFTLIHDDIMDNDELRRNLPSVHVVYGNTTAILAGDLLFAKAFEICDKRVPGILGRASSEICEGQEMDMAFEERNDVPEDEYMTMIKKKTAALIKASTKSGAILGNAPDEEIEAMAAYGINIGYAFQIHDDILDLIGDEKRIGKPVGSDIAEGKKTLIAIKAMELLKTNERNEFIGILNKKEKTSSDINRAVELIKKCGAIDYCKNKEAQVIERAKKSLYVLPDSPAKQDLLNIADFIIKREG